MPGMELATFLFRPSECWTTHRRRHYRRSSRLRDAAPPRIPCRFRRLPAYSCSEMMRADAMTESVAPAVPAPVPSPAALRWLASKDTDFLVTKRSVRAAVIMPSAFAVAHVVSSNGQVGLFAAFGSFALLLMVDFTGALRQRAASYIGLYAVSSWVHRAGHRCVDPRSGGGARHGVRGFRGAVRRNRLADRGDGDDRRALDVRVAGCRGGAGDPGRAPVGGLDAGRRILHPGLPAGLADTVARQPAAEGGDGGVVRGPAGR